MRNPLKPVVGIGLLCVLLSALQAACELPPEPATSTPGAVLTPTSQPTPTHEAVPTPTPQPTPTLRQVPTPEPVPTPTFAPEPPPTQQSTPKPYATPHPLPTPTLTPEPTSTPQPTPTLMPTLAPTPTPTPMPTPTPKRLCERATPQPITPEQEALISEGPEALKPRMREFAAHAPEAFKQYTQRFQYNYYSPTLRPFITLALCDQALALRLLGMPFLADDDGTGLDGDVLAALARLTDPDVGDLDELLLHPLLEEGIREIDRVVVLLLVLEYENPDAAANIRSLPLAQELMREVALSANDIDISKLLNYHWTLYELIRMVDRSPESLRELLKLPWMKGQGIQARHWLTGTLRSIESSIHAMAVHVRHIAEKSDDGMASVLRMPFMQTLEPDDADILDILWETGDAGRSWTDGETPLRQLLSTRYWKAESQTTTWAK